MILQETLQQIIINTLKYNTSTMYISTSTSENNERYSFKFYSKCLLFVYGRAHYPL